MKHLARRCLGDHSAGVALLFALSALPVIGVIGIAIDFGLATQAKTQLNLAADAAALAAAKGAADAFTAGNSVDKARAAGEAAGREWFRSQAGTVLGSTLQDPDVKVPQPNGGVFTSQVTYQGTVKPYFAPIFGVSTIALGGSSRATITTNAYVSVTFLLDNSSSMLIAATQDGINTMHKVTPYSNKQDQERVPRWLGRPRVGQPNARDNWTAQCAYACHWDANNNDYYGLALKNNVKLRLDVLKEAATSAVQLMIDQSKINKIDKQYSIAIYKFARDLTTVYPEDTDLDKANAALGDTRVPLVSDNGDTDFPTIMRKLGVLANNSSKPGDGSSTTSRRKSLIIVTDGMADYYKDGKPDGRVIPTSEGPINPVDCDGMKKIGYSVYVLYTTYISSPPDLMLHFDRDLEAYINGTAKGAMVPSLQSCASAPTNYVEASDPTAINAAMKRLLQSALSNGGRYYQ